LEHVDPCGTHHAAKGLALPQQLPGPAQPAAAPGVLPQQAVSPKPGMSFLGDPDIDEWAERSFLRSSLPQAPHVGGSDDPVTRTSLVLPHLRHR